MHACDRQTDGQTDGRTDRITTPKTAIVHARAVKTRANTVQNSDNNTIDNKYGSYPDWRVSRMPIADHREIQI